MQHVREEITSESSRWKRMASQLWLQVIVAGVLGIVVGWIWPALGAGLAVLNTWFIALLKMIVIPVIFCVIVSGIGAMSDLKQAGRIGVKSISYFIVLSLLSMLIGLLVGNIFKPGQGMNIDSAALNSGALPEAASSAHHSVSGFVSSMIPETLFGALTTGHILAALLVSILFGVALNVAGEESRPLARGIDALSRVVFLIVDWVMRLAPLGTFGAMAAIVATNGADTLIQLGYLIALFMATCVAYVVVVLGLIMRACGLSLFRLMRFLKEELLVVLSTCSSESVLPRMLQRLEALGVSRSTVGIVIPSGFSFNLDGSAVYLTMTYLFLAQATGTDATWTHQLLVVGLMMLMSKGTAGIAGGAFIILASVIGSMGTIPVGALALIVGIDRILNEGRVFINVLGNAVAAIVIAKWEGEFDHQRALKILSGEKTEDLAQASG